jgi:hypothetical protein
MFRVLTNAGKPLNCVHVPDTKRQSFAPAAGGGRLQDRGLRARTASIPADPYRNGAIHVRCRSARIRRHPQIIELPEGIASVGHYSREHVHHCDAQ